MEKEIGWLLFPDEGWLPTSRLEAEQFLRVALSVLAYLEAFRVLFPADYAREVEQILRHQAPLFPAIEQAYTPLEQHFLTCVHEHLFPLGDLEDVFADDSAEMRYYTIPVNPIGLDDVDLEEMYYGPDHCRPGWVLMLYLTGFIDDEMFADGYAQAEAYLALPLQHGYVAMQVLRNECQQLSGPISGLAATVGIIEHSTNLIWLDATSEMPCERLEWTTENLTMLAEQYRAARALDRQSDEFIQWLEQQPLAHFTEVVHLWNRCMQQTSQQANQEVLTNQEKARSRA
ncbi:MAG TPA: hypothetical protein VFV38_03780 [Ktedonobacteraceae bacterium]|nr:hypothetical protein [Ktedonobacteraceae bacterium]